MMTIKGLLHVIILTIGWFSSTAYMLLIRCDLVTLTFDFLTLDNGHVVNLFTNFEDPMPVLPYIT